MSVVVLAVASPTLILAFCWRHPLAPGLMAVLTCVVPVALAALGATRGGRLGWLAGPLVGLLAVLLTAALAIVALSAETGGGRWPLGLGVLLGGLWLVPLALSVWAHAVGAGPPSGR